MLRAVLLFIALAVPALCQAQPGAGPYHLVVVTAPTPSEAGVRLLDNIANDPTMAKLMQYCEFTELQTDSVMYQQRYANALPPNRLPVVAFCDRNGGVIYKASGPNVPSSGERLAKAIIETNREFQKAVAAQRLAGGIDWWEWSGQEQCPNCPDTSPQQPNRPNRPDTPNRPVRPLLDGLDDIIPDTVDIQPQITIGEGLTVPVMVGVGLIVLLVIGGFLFVMLLLVVGGWFVLN